MQTRKPRLRRCSRAAHLGGGAGDGFHANFQWTSAVSVASTLGNGFVRLSTRVTMFLDGDSGQDVGALEAALISDTIQKGLWTGRGPKLCPDQQWGKYHLRAWP